MQAPPEHHRSGRLWLIAGTGEGPVLAKALLARGWRLRLSVVAEAAARAYPPEPSLELAVGAIGEGEGLTPELGLEQELRAAENAGDPYAWVLDASHPFATTISAALARVCGARGQPLLRLGRPLDPHPGAVLLDDLPQLEGCVARGERLLLAIGARQLPLAVRHSPGAVHHARLLPDATALRIVMAAGLAPARVACLRPGGEGRIEAALCRHWRIDAVLCRQSGGHTEALWRRICRDQGIELRLLRRPPEPEGVRILPLAELLAHVGSSVST
ncbi:precorrin-6A/cobalt-precorrin-6A reductase [Cyanobium sp. FGCU-6]|jgi:precorrin-6A/cobalt-precorrin-6A reductase|nr:precorrin-6A/cobalt-precorrin-6A reductase [Cyanobium sp. FGCU6]